MSNKRNIMINTLTIVVGVLIMVVIFTQEVFLEVKMPPRAIEVNSSWECPKEAHLFNQDLSEYVHTYSEVDTSRVGEYDIRIQIKYLCINKIYDRKIKVIDTEPPKIKIMGENPAEATDIKDYKDPGIIATDNYSRNLKKEKELKKISSDTYKIRYKVEDSSGNVAKTERTIIIKNKGTIYLTFDDGPSSSVTPLILDTLSKEEITATFFVINSNSNDFEELLKREASEGHTIGLHGYSHDYKEVYSSLFNLEENFFKIEERVKETTGIESKIIRFPGGSSNTVSCNYCKGIMTAAVDDMQQKGYDYYDWNVSSGDAGETKNSDTVYENVTNGLHEGDNIVLMHDSSGHEFTAEALPKIIQYGKANGFIFKPIDEDTTPIHHPINN